MLAASIPNASTSAALVETATKWRATAASSRSAASAHSRAVRAFRIVSRVVNVLDETMNRVSTGSRSLVASAKSVPSTFETNRNTRSRRAYARSASYAITGPRSEPPMPMFTTFRIGRPVYPVPAPERTRSAKAAIRSSPASTASRSPRPGSSSNRSRRCTSRIRRACASSVVHPWDWGSGGIGRHSRPTGAGAPPVPDSVRAVSAMRETMPQQPALLRELLADATPVAAAALRLEGRRVLLVGTGTSWHAANHGAWFLREAGVEAWAVEAVDAALHGPLPGADDALVLLSHRGTKRYTSAVLERARAAGAATVVISRRGSPGVDIETSDPERSSAP